MRQIQQINYNDNFFQHDKLVKKNISDHRFPTISNFVLCGGDFAIFWCSKYFQSFYRKLM